MHGRRILVIDDDRYVCKLVVDIFCQEGAQVYAAGNGAEGLRQFYLCRPHLIILDIMMPDMDGWELCNILSHFSDVPIIFLTALDGANNIVRGLECGALDYVSKPFSPKVLVARARAALRQMEGSSTRDKATAYSDDHLTIAPRERRVLVRGEQVELTATEYRLLAYFFNMPAKSSPTSRS